MTHHGTKTIRTERLTLRRFSPADAEAMFAGWASDERVTAYLSWSPHKSVDETRRVLAGWCALYRNPAYYHWCIVCDGRPVGGISVVRQSEKNDLVELGYCLCFDVWGRGIAAEATRAVMGYFFAHAGVHRVEIRHAVDNIASGRVAEKCGMTSEGILRGHTKLANGTYADVRVWGILREEYEARPTDPENLRPNRSPQASGSR